MELKHGFKKVNKMLFEYTVSPELFKKMDDIVGEISNGKADKCMDVHNMYLLDNLLSRYIATLFLETGEELDNVFGMGVILVRVQERSFRISLGHANVSKDETRFMHAVIYDD